MNVFIIIKLLCCVFVLTKACDANSFSSAKCGFLSPEIRFPFRIQGIQQHNCGQFNLFCKDKKTMIHFPSYGDLVVKSISYDTGRLALLDPKNCVHQVFLNLNLSLTPFSYYHAVKQYKYINCSAKVVASFEQVPCLSGSNYHVYTVDPSFSVPVYCTCIKTVAIPFSYSHYLSDSSFGLGLTWSSIGLNEASPGCKPGILCETGHERSKKYFKVSSVIVLVFMVGMLFYATLSQYFKKLDEEKVKKILGEVEIEKLLGDYEALSLTRDTQT